jgi:hypothetical protein
MKKITFALVAGLASTTTLAASANPVDQYLIDHGFKAAPIQSSYSVGATPAAPEDARTAYLVESGFLSLHRKAGGAHQPQTAEPADPAEQLLVDWGFKAAPQSDRAVIVHIAPATDDRS